MQIIRDGFVWFKVTDKAKEIYESKLFDLYVLLNDKERLIVNDIQIELCLLSKKDIYIKVGHHLDVLKVMYDFMGHYGKSLSKAYRPTEDFNYEQFLVAHFSNLMEQEL
jgi:hypothetical protein